MMKIVKSLSIIMAVVAVVAGGTYAWQLQKETISGVTFSAGSADLKIDQDLLPESQSWTDSFGAPSIFQMDKLVPGYTDDVIVNIKNQGDILGTASVRLDLKSNNENGVLSPELEAGDNALNDIWDGELAQNIWVKISYKQEADTNFVEKYNFTLAQYEANPSMLVLGDILPGAVSDNDLTGVGNVKFEWSIPANVSNKIMTDSVNVDVIFGLE